MLDGKFGFLDAYCRETDAAPLTAGLGTNWETLLISTKRYPCHMNAHTPVQAVRELMSEHGFSGKEVSDVLVEGHHVLVSHHDIKEPADITKAQYSVPFCVAVALFRDPEDPASFDAAALPIRTSARRAARSSCATSPRAREPPKARALPCGSPTAANTLGTATS